MTAPPKWHVYVGTEIGLLKGVDTENKKFSNLNSFDGLCKGDEITAMCWEDSKEEKVYIGRKNQVVQTFDCATQSFSEPRSCRVGEGAIKGIYQFNNQLVTAVESGIVKLWNENEEQNALIDTKGKLSKMTPNPFVNSQVATGGEENDLKVWDLQAPNSPVFQARNVPHDFLDLRVPVWITDMKFKSANNIVTCTRHHQIRLYDTRAQRRPVIDMEFERYPLMCLSLAHNDNQVVVGSSRGRMVLIDLRRKLLVHAFKGFAGSIRSIHCHPTLPLVASCGLDRFLRIHDLNLHRLLKKIYLKTRLNCLLYQTDSSYPNKPPKPPAIKNVKEVVVDAEEEGMWNAMPLVKEQHSVKRLHRIDALAIAKKKRKKAAVS
ncbi:WD repeat-containing protein 74 [Trichonephila clavata]|uniref:WD repeat-containing protein 74 n=1 Tax=Trichonephila clavata TaxID=2740835 RepID=A0A8X6LHV2_TRICU|nr:WD repeat-containing protein 74 [Trichonephila clavata]